MTQGESTTTLSEISGTSMAYGKDQNYVFGLSVPPWFDRVVGWDTLLPVLAIAAAAGFLGGLFGKGGSAIATPLLAAIGIPPIIAVASPLPATVPSTAIASYAYWREQLLDWRVVLWSVGFGVPAVIAGAYATRWIGGTALVEATEVLIVGLGVRFVLRPGGAHERVVDVSGMRGRMAAVAIGAGLAAGLLANSGGFLLAPLYLAVLRLPIKQAFASSLAVACVLAVPGTIVHAALGHVDWALVVAFGAGSIPLSYVGARVALRTHAARLERVYGAVLVVLGLGLLVTTV
jgi:uncharacterized membrane protein YfcA